VVIAVPTFTAALGVVAATDLVATIPASFAETYGARLGVVIVGGPRQGVEISMSWHDRTHADPASVAFRTLVKSAVLDGRITAR
jgi:DNA-binding transcriptional LysR family regulator